MQKITINEYGKIKVGTGKDSISRAQFEALDRYNKRTKERYFKVGNNEITFRHYVGVFKVGKTSIEVLPKISDDETENQQWFLKMLRYSGLHKHIFTNSVKQNKKTFDLYKLFYMAYLTELNRLLAMGLTKKYSLTQGNLGCLKGKLMLNKHLQKNVVVADKFYVEYQTYSFNHPINQTLLKALQVIKVTASASTAAYAAQLEQQMFSIKTHTLTQQKTVRIKLNRKTESHTLAFELAKMIIGAQTPDIRLGNHPLVGLVINMDSLWERFVRHVLIKYFKNDVVLKPDRLPLYVSGETTISQQPDVVIYSNSKLDTPLMVFDAKWKKEKPALIQGDLRQLYAYGRLMGNIPACLVYPTTGKLEIEKGTFKGSPDSRAFILWLPVHCDLKNVEAIDLQPLWESNLEVMAVKVREMLKAQYLM